MNERAVCNGVGLEPIERDGEWVCPSCGVPIPAEEHEPLAPADYAAWLASPGWKALRDAAVASAGGRCRGCNTEATLEVHHRTYERVGHELMEDLTVLCAPCHTAVHLVADARRGVTREHARKAWG